MPIVSPQLDDLNYDRVVQELQRRIPVYSPEWTDFNDSDPGITMIQLFAHLAEMIGYRLNRIPEKNQIELLQLLGIELAPAQAATTQLALLLQQPPTFTAYPLLAGASATANAGSPPPAFETVVDVDVVPAEPVVLVTTASNEIWAPGAGLTVVWDGQSPALKDMPLQPVSVKSIATQPYLWVGVNFNADMDAGFRNVQVTLTIQFDDDEQPTLVVTQECGPESPQAEVGKLVNWLSYYDTAQNAMLPVQGRIQDTTNQLANSGKITFTVPMMIGVIPASDWTPTATTPTALASCQTLATNIVSAGGAPVFSNPNPNAADISAWINSYASALQAGLQKTTTTPPPSAPPPALDPKYYGVMGWFLIDLHAIASTNTVANSSIRMVTFNAVGVINATSVTNELVGTADGTPGQTYQLANTNIQSGSLSVAIQESPESDNEPLVTWSVVDSLDAAGPNDSWVALDPEAGTLLFGDGIHGRIAPLVPQGGSIIALQYNWGGGESGNVAVATVTAKSSSGSGIAGVVNYVAAAGGRDPETLEDAEIRARKEISTRTRAVTASDFEWIATQTTGVEVARAQCVPLEMPLAAGSTINPLTTVLPSMPSMPLAPSTTVPAGLDSTQAPGVVSVVVVPNQPIPEPAPTPSFLRTVAQYLDGFRLVTTEVYIVPPQYFRLYNVQVTVAGAPGYTRAQLQDLVATRLSTYLNVLTGGDDGAGFDFGSQIYAADLVAQIYRVEGVERVDSFTANFVRTKTNANPRQGTFTLCPSASATDQYSKLTLDADENVSFNTDTFILSTGT